MKTLFEAERVAEVKQRLGQLTADSPRIWGTMDVSQALAHCTAAMETAVGERVVPRNLLGRIVGGLAKRFVVVKQNPIPRNAKAPEAVVVTDACVFAVERERLSQKIDRFAEGGPAICTKHPHFFFGPLTPEEWASLMYQHLDHHLRQFGV